MTAYADSKDPALRDAIDKMVAHLPDDGDGAFIIKSLMTWVRLTGSPAALEQAKKRVDAAFGPSGMFTPDNKIPRLGHIHGSLRALVGAADYALYVKDPVLFSRVDAIYRYMRSKGTRFGFLPEVMDRHGDIISCETCALMDFVGLATTLANNGHPEYWGDVERMLRNQLVESQLVDGSWLKPGDKPDTEQFSWREIGDRMVGGYAGWSSPTHFLAAREELSAGAGRSCAARPVPFRIAAAARARTASSSFGKTPPASRRARSRSTCTSTSCCRKPKSAASSRIKGD